MSSRRKRSNYTPGMTMPSANKSKSRRVIFGLVLLFLFPPLGILTLWRMEIFRVRGRMILTLLATVEMGIVIAFMMPASTLPTVSPIPGTAPSITSAPESSAVDALSNMDELLQAQQNASATATPEPVTQQSQLDSQQDVLNTTVYCVTVSGARFYHTSTECDGQSNPRALTVREALAEGLSPCTKCNPPTYSVGTSGDE